MAYYSGNETIAKDVSMFLLPEYTCCVLPGLYG